MKNYTPLRPRYWEWSLLVFLFLAMRVGGLLFFHPAYNNVCAIEEYFRGALAQEILHGLAMPYWQYRPDDFAGGSLAIGVLAAGFFKIFGASAFVLKMIPVLFSLGALAIWFVILNREISRRCAWYFALFFIFAPSYFQSWSLVALGDHYETMLFSALAVWLFLRMSRSSLRGQANSLRNVIASPSCFSTGAAIPGPEIASSLSAPRNDVEGQYSWGTPLLLGILCGFGVWFAYIFALSVIAILVLWFLKDRRLLLKGEFWTFALGFLIGFSPWIFLNLQTQFQGLTIQGGYLWHHINPLWSFYYWKIYYWDASVFYEFFYSFLHPRLWFGAPVRLVNWLYMGLLSGPLLLWFILVRRTGSRKEETLKAFSPVAVFFLIYTVLHLLAVQFTNFKAPRYMMPLMPAVFFAWARLMDILESVSPKARQWCRFFFAVPMLGLGILLWFSMLSPGHAGFLLRQPGHRLDYWSNTPACQAVTSPHVISVASCLDLYRRAGEKISAEEAQWVWNTRTSGLELDWLYKQPRPDSKYLAELTPVERAAYYFHLGRYLFEYHGRELEAALTDIQNRFGDQSSVVQLCLMGVFEALDKAKGEEPPMKPSELSTTMHAEYNRYIGRQSSRYGQDHRIGGERVFREIERSFPALSTAEKIYVLQGMGSFFAENVFYEPLLGAKQYAKAKHSLAGEDRKAFEQGVGRVYEVNRLFYPAPCETWSHEYLPRDVLREAGFEEGRRQIRTMVEALSSQGTSPVAGEGGL